MNITISGDLGAGKTTAAALLGRDGWNVISTGLLFRQEAAESGRSVAELTECCRRTQYIDMSLDRRLAALGKSEDHTVFDCRLGYHLVPGAANIMLVCNRSVAARRVMEACRQGERYESVSAALAGLATRRAAERERFIGLYGTDPWDRSNYDLVIDTTRRTPEEVARCIEGYVAQRQRLANGKAGRFPEIVFPKLRIEHGQGSTSASFTVDVPGRTYEAQFTSWKAAPEGMAYSAAIAEIGWDGMKQIIWHDSSESLKDLSRALENVVQELQDQALDRQEEDGRLWERAGVESYSCMDEEMER